jgi:ATP synthase protein I
VDPSKEPLSPDDLAARLRAARAREDRESGRAEPQRGRASSTGMGLGFRIAVELVAGIAVGTFIGYALDAWLGTKPWFMVVFLFLGGAAGVMNVYRAAKGLDDAVGLGEAERRQDRDRTDG